MCLTVKFENLCDGSLHIGSRVQGGGHERPEDTLSQVTAFEYWSVVQKRAQLLCKLWVYVLWRVWCHRVEMVRWCGEGGHYPLLDSWAPVRHRQTPFGSCWARVGCGAAEGSSHSSDTLIQSQHSVESFLVSEKQGPVLRLLNNVMWSYFYCLRQGHVHTQSVR